MASRVTRDHHNLRRNLKLNGNYISNDGGDEGISIQDDGDVIINGDTKLYLNDAGGEYLNGDGTDLIIASGNDCTIDATGDIILDADGQQVYFKKAGTTIGIVKTSTASTFHLQSPSNYHLKLESQGVGDITLDATGGDVIILQADLTIPSSKKVILGDAGEYISGDGTDLTIGGNIINLNSDAGVGIGNTAPGSLLEVTALASASASDRPCIEISSFSDANVLSTSAGVLKFHKSHNDNLNTYGANSHTAAGEIIGRIEAWGVTNDDDGSSDAPVLSSYIEFAGDGVADETDAPGKIRFATADGNDNGAPTVRMTLDDGGKLGIGVANPDEALEVDGDIHVHNVVYFDTETGTIVADGATGVIDWRNGNKQKLTITGTGITINFTNPGGACNVLLKVVQGDGSDIVGTWDDKVKWAGGSAPTLSTGNGEIDILSFYFDGTNYHGVASLDFSAP